MSEFQKVRTVEDLANLDDAEILAGYRSGLDGDAEPGSDKSRSFWHGWRNGITDRGIQQPDAAQMMLVRQYVGTYRGLN